MRAKRGELRVSVVSVSVINRKEGFTSGNTIRPVGKVQERFKEAGPHRVQ
jgi:hypothetical protein